MGQYAAEARFLLIGGANPIWLTEDGLWLIVPDPVEFGQQSGSAGSGTALEERLGRERSEVAPSGTAIRLTFPGANPTPALEPFGPAATHISYLLGGDPSGWQRHVPVWSGARYRDFYPGIDLVIGGDAGGSVPWRLEAQPWADVQAVMLQVQGVEAVSAAQGKLQLQVKGRSIGLIPPAWSIVGQADAIGSTVVAHGQEGFFAVLPEPQLGSAEASSAAPDGISVPDGVIYTTFLAGAGLDTGYAIALDHQGNAYITGETRFSDFPGVPPGSFSGTTDAFVAKFNAAGALVYLTYLGGSEVDASEGIAVGADLAYIVGSTQSAGFPRTTDTAQGSDIFVVALGADGSDIRYATLLGGDGFDYGYGIALQDTDAYIVGSTQSTDLPGETGCASALNRDVVVARFDTLKPLGNPEYTTCFGGSDLEEGWGVAVRNGIAYVTGKSKSSLPGSPDFGEDDIFIAIFDANGDHVRSRLFGGALEDWGNSIAVDANGNFYIAGGTASPFLASSAVGWGGGTDGVVLKMSSTFAGYFVTYLGGNGEDEAQGIAVDTVQGLYVTGSTTSTNFRGTAGKATTDTDVFVARMHLSSTNAAKVTYATYLGGTMEDVGYGVATDTGGNAFVTGSRSQTLAVDPDQASADVLVAKVLAGQPLPAPILRIRPSDTGADAELYWDPVTGADKYQVFLSSMPYFIPGDWNSPLPLAEPAASPLFDSGALTQVDARFYIVKTVDTAATVGLEASASSNRVGKLTFQLVPGN